MVILDISIENYVTTFITYVHFFNNPLKKTHHHAIDIRSIEVELFAIRCRINQVVQIPSFPYIIVITDTIHIA